MHIVRMHLVQKLTSLARALGSIFATYNTYVKLQKRHKPSARFLHFDFSLLKTNGKKIQFALICTKTVK